MSVGHLLTAATTAVLDGSGPTTPAAAHAVAQSPDVGAYTLTVGRFWGTAAALLGLAGAIIGGLGLARAVRRIGGGGRKGAIVALVAGSIAVVGGALNLAVADGGPGTGNGVVGGALAVVLGLLAVVLGGLALARTRHTLSTGAGGRS